MGFNNRISDNPNRKRLHIESIETDSGGNIKSIVITGIERLDEPVSVEGTKLEAKSFLRALYEIEGGIDPVDLVEIDSDTRYWYFNVGYGQSMTFTFNYLGPEVYADFVNNEYFTANAIKINENRIDVTLIAKPAVGEVEHSTEVYFDVNFRLVSNSQFVTTEIIGICITPIPIWPND